SDERILGDGDFVDQVLSAAKEQMEKKYKLAAEGYDLDKIASKVCDVMQLEPFNIWATGKERTRVEARSLLCYWAVRDLGINMAELSRRLNLSLSGVSLSVKRGERIVQEKGYKLIEL
ncbi:MAG: transposase, partial [Desulfobacterales bacterium]|nr:transposase [Desulfobacterales bacterium]